MKKRFFTFLTVAIGLLLSTNVFANNETDVSLNVLYTYSVNFNTGTETDAVYHWNITGGTAGTDFTDITGESGSSVGVTWNTAGTYSIEVYVVDGLGCQSETKTLSVTVTSETYCVSNQTNTTTCSLIDSGSGNSTSSDADYFTFDVTISHPSTSGTYTINFTVDGTSGSKTITGVTAGTDKTETIQVNHSEFTTEFTNTGSADVSVPIVITGVTNSSSNSVSECSTPFTFTDISVHPKPVISF